MLVSHAGLIVSEPVTSAFSCGSCIKGPLLKDMLSIVTIFVLSVPGCISGPLAHGGYFV